MCIKIVTKTHHFLHCCFQVLVSLVVRAQQQALVCRGRVVGDPLPGGVGQAQCYPEVLLCQNWKSGKIYDEDLIKRVRNCDTLTSLVADSGIAYLVGI